MSSENNLSQTSEQNYSTLSLETLNFVQGDQFNLEPKKYSVLEFWATWCPPCVKSIPHLNEIYHEYKDYINFVSITDDKTDKIISFINAKKDIMTYPVANDVDHVLHDELKITGIPVLFIIDGAGKSIWSGHPMDDQVKKELDKIKNI